MFHCYQNSVVYSASVSIGVLPSDTYSMLISNTRPITCGMWDLRPDLFVLDDFGLKPMPPSAAAGLYDVIDGRYE